MSSTPSSHFWAPGFKFWPINQLSWGFFVLWHEAWTLE
jgi:hypothetical protein